MSCADPKKTVGTCQLTLDYTDSYYTASSQYKVTILAQEANVSASTQNQVFNALLFPSRDVLHIELDAPIQALRAKRAQQLPTVRSKNEVNQVVNGMQGLQQLMTRLLYGCGLRLMECLRLHVKGINFEQSQIIVRQGKAEKDRLTMLPASLVEPLKSQVAFVSKQHERDLADGCGSVELPFALARKCPNADKELAWQYVFPSDRLSAGPAAGLPAATISTPAVYSGRLRPLQNWRNSIRLNRGPKAVRSPLDE